MCNLPWINLEDIDEEDLKYYEYASDYDLKAFQDDNEKHVEYYKALVSNIYSIKGRKAPEVLVGNCDKFYEVYVGLMYYAYELIIDYADSKISLELELDSFDKDIINKYDLTNESIYKGSDYGIITDDNEIFEDLMEDIIAGSRFVPIAINRLVSNNTECTYTFDLIKRYMGIILKLDKTDVLKYDSKLFAEFKAYSSLSFWVEGLKHKPNPKNKYSIKSTYPINESFKYKDNVVWLTKEKQKVPNK